VKAVIKILSF